MMKVYVNQSGVYEGSMAVVEHQDKDQAAWLEIADLFILCSHQAFKTHIKSIAVFIHKDGQMEVAQSRFTNKEGEGDLTRLESGMSFLQVRASMSMKEKVRQFQSAICVNRREIAHTRLEAIARANNPYSLITIFGRGHLAVKAGGAIYHPVRASGSVASISQELHRGKTSYSQRDGNFCGPYQLCNQECWLPGVLQ
jgi:hypothetical protein